MEKELKNIVLQHSLDDKRPEDVYSYIYHFVAAKYVTYIRNQIKESVKKQQYSKIGNRVSVDGKLDVSSFRVYDVRDGGIHNARGKFSSNEIKISSGADDISIDISSGVASGGPLPKSKVVFSLGRKCESSIVMRTSSHWKNTYNILKQLTSKEGIHIEYEFAYGQLEKDTRKFATWGSRVFVCQGTAKEGESITWQYSSDDTPSVQIHINYNYAFEI